MPPRLRATTMAEAVASAKRERVVTPWPSAAPPRPPRAEIVEQADSGPFAPDTRPEAEIQRDFATALTGGGYTFRWARLDQRSAMTPGWPDFDVALPGARMLFLEFKNSKGVLSDDQRKIHASLLAHGHAVRIPRSVPEAMAMVRAAHALALVAVEAAQ